MPLCESTSFVFPMQADIFYPIIEQTSLGSIKKQWVLDRTIACNFTTAGSAMSEDVKPNITITQDFVLLGRTAKDPRISSTDTNLSVTNIIITNIRDISGNQIYMETAGPRAGKPTLFEIAGNEPYINPFGSIEFFKITLRRSENQGAEI